MTQTGDKEKAQILPELFSCEWYAVSSFCKLPNYFLQYRSCVLVTPAGFEPAIYTLRGCRPRPLDDGATTARSIYARSQWYRHSHGLSIVHGAPAGQLHLMLGAPCVDSAHQAPRESVSS